MTTPLQKAAKVVIDRWDAPSWKDQPHTAEYINELRKALDAEIAQAAEPVAFMRPSIEGYDSSYRDANVVVMSKASGATHWDESGWVPLYLHPPQPQATTAVPSGERADSAQWLREFADMEFSYYSLEATQLRKAADMLEADAQQDKPYDQQSMDLCDTCGWKGIFPGEPCLVCAQQAKRVPLSDDQIEELAEGIAWDDYAHDLARRVEKHHGITPADKPTDDESEDLYALALKADNWGQP